MGGIRIHAPLGNFESYTSNSATWRHLGIKLPCNSRVKTLGCRKSERLLTCTASLDYRARAGFSAKSQLRKSFVLAPHALK